MDTREIKEKRQMLRYKVLWKREKKKRDKDRENEREGDIKRDKRREQEGVEGCEESQEGNDIIKSKQTKKLNKIL